MSWVPPQIRGTAEEAEWTALREGVPAGLGQPLIAWVRQFFHKPDNPMVPELGRLHRVAVSIGIDYGIDPWKDLRTRMATDPDLLIAVTDWCLCQVDPGSERVRLLEELLRDARSIWRVGHTSGVQLPTALSDMPTEFLGDDGKTRVKMPSEVGHFELQRRIDPTVEEAVRSAAPAGSPAAYHLAQAWHQTYSRTPNWTSAYSETMYALESATRAIVLPKDDKATLGKVIGEMKANRTAWVTPLREPGVDAVIAIMEALWTQNERHGRSERPIVVGQAEAESALQMAASLVRMFTSGAVIRVP